MYRRKNTGWKLKCMYWSGWDISVGIATRYGLDSLGIESWWGREILHLSRPALRPTQPPVQWVPGLSRGKVAGAWRWPSTPSSTKVKERVELYLYSPSGPSWPVRGWILPLPLPLCTGEAEVLIWYPWFQTWFIWHSIHFDKDAYVLVVSMSLF